MATGVTTSFVVKAPVTISFLIAGFGATGPGILISMTGCTFASILGGSILGMSGGTVSLGGINFANTVRGGGVSLGTGGVSTGGGTYKGVTVSVRRSISGVGGNQRTNPTSALTATPCSTKLQASLPLSLAGANS